jgi:hypothetical protein
MDGLQNASGGTDEPTDASVAILPIGIPSRKPEMSGHSGEPWNVATFRQLCERRMVLGAAGIWLDTFIVRYRLFVGPNDPDATQQSISDAEQAGGQAREMIRNMSRHLLSPDAATHSERHAQTAADILRHIRISVTQMFQSLETPAESRQFVQALKEAFDDENEEVMGGWLE